MKQAIVHVTLVVCEYDEAIRWYAEKLLFRVVEDTYQPEQDKRTCDRRRGDHQDLRFSVRHVPMPVVGTAHAA